MMGPSHRLLGALAGAAVTSAGGHSWSMVAAGALIGQATAHGWPSPDMDQTKPWRALAGVSGPLRPMFAHRRGLSHWWGLPAAWWTGIGHLPADARWVFVALLAGWVSHLLGDLVFGKLYLFPWGGPGLGLELRTDGFIEDGSVRFGGRKFTVIPFGPTRVAITLALGWVLYATPTLPTATTLIGAAP